MYNDIATACIECQMQLSPSPAGLGALVVKVSDRAIDLQAGTVDHHMKWTARHRLTIIIMSADGFQVRARRSVSCDRARADPIPSAQAPNRAILRSGAAAVRTSCRGSAQSQLPTRSNVAGRLVSFSAGPAIRPAPPARSTGQGCRAGEDPPRQLVTLNFVLPLRCRRLALCLCGMLEITIWLRSQMLTSNH